MIRESELGAYLGPTPRLTAVACPVATNPHFDVFDLDDQRLILVKCSRLPDDEDRAAPRYGIDFHRGLPPFEEDTGFSCDWGDGPIAVNAYNYARYLPQTLKFREFTANLAFAARTWAEYQAKRRVYQDFYQHLYNSPSVTILAAPHSGTVHRPPDDYQPFPQAEMDAWTGRVAVRCLRPRPQGRNRILVSLHSTDYFGALLDIGDFGLPQNHLLAQLLAQLKVRFSDRLAAILPAYRDYIMPYTRGRLQWFDQHWGTLDPQRLAPISTAARFELLCLAKVLGDCLRPKKGYTLLELRRGLEKYWERPTLPSITLNGIFSGRKTARLLNLADNLRQAGLNTAVQVECSRFLARYYPDLTAALITALIDGLEMLP